MPGQVRILAVDGGGMRGIISASVIAEIEKRLDRPINESFHMIAGTSSGGLIAAGLTHPSRPMTAQQLIDMNVQKGPEIFRQNFWHRMRSLDGLIHYPKYKTEATRKAIEPLIGDKKLSDVTKNDLLLTSFDLNSGKSVIFTSWEARGIGLADPAASKARHDFKLIDTLLATTAAPGRFPPVDIKDCAGNSYKMIDGGVFAADPTYEALYAATQLYPDADSFMIVSVGSGKPGELIKNVRSVTMSQLEWGNTAEQIVLAAGSSSALKKTQALLSRVGNNSGLFRLDPVLTAVGNISAEQLNRIDGTSPAEMAAMRHLAAGYVKQNEDQVRQIVDALKPPLSSRDELGYGLSEQDVQRRRKARLQSIELPPPHCPPAEPPPSRELVCIPQKDAHRPGWRSLRMRLRRSLMGLLKRLHLTALGPTPPAPPPPRPPAAGHRNNPPPAP